MTPAELNAAMHRLGWGATALSRHIDRPRQTVTQWQIGRVKMPEDVGAWIERRLIDLARDPPPRRPKISPQLSAENNAPAG